MKNKPKSDKLVYLSTIFLMFVLVLASIVLFRGCTQQISQREIEPEKTIEEPISVETPKIETVTPITVEEEKLPEPQIEEPKEEIIEVPIEKETPKEIIPVIKIPVEEPPKEEPKEEILTETIIEEPTTVVLPKIPKIPIIYTPDVTESLWSDDYYSQDFDSQNQEDPWADFVSSDEYTQEVEGFRAVTVKVNGEKSGEIEAEIEDNIAKFNSVELSEILSPLLTENFYKQFFANQEPYYLMDWFDSLGIDSTFNLETLELDFEFTSEQLPIRTISIGGDFSSIKRSEYKVEGQENLNPSNVSFYSNITLFGNFIADKNLNFISQNISLGLSNTVSFFGAVIDFNTNLSYSPDYGFNLTSSNLLASYDFVDKSIRLSVGRIGSGFGVSLIKSSYGVTGQIQGKTYERVIEVEERSKITISNNGVVVFIRTVSAGTYRLNDFIFIQGANHIKLTIHPERMGDDTSKDQEFDLNAGFDSSLLNEGETRWSFSATVPMEDQTTTTLDGFVVPWFSLDGSIKNKIFKLNTLDVYWSQNTGLAFNLTENHSLNLSFTRNYITGLIETDVSANLGIIWANPFGLTGLYFSGEKKYDLPISYSISFQQKFFDEKLKKLSLSGGFYHSSTSDRLDFKASYSFGKGNFNFTTAASIGYDFSNITDPLTWSVSTSAGFTFGRGINLSLSLGMSNKMDLRGTIGLSIVLGPNATSTSTVGLEESDITDGDWNSLSILGNTSLSVKPFGSDKHSIQLGLSNLDLANLINHNLNASWTYSGDLFGFNMNLQALNGYDRYLGSFSANTAIGYSGGFFGMAKSISDSFIIINPEGTLKHSGISYSSSAQSSSKAITKMFGNALITGLTPYQKNSLVVFCESDSLFGSGGTFILGMEPRTKQGYVKTVKIVPTLTVSGLLLKTDGTPYEQYSSPIYKVEKVDGELQIQDMSQGFYLFTDIYGRFIISGLDPGDYFFDLSVDKQWYAVCFNVPEIGEASQVVLLEDLKVGEEQLNDIYEISDYNKTVEMSLNKIVEEQEFWDQIFTVPADNEFDDWSFAEDFKDDFSTQENEISDTSTQEEVKTMVIN